MHVILLLQALVTCLPLPHSCQVLTMSGVNEETMKRLFAEQRRDLLSDMKEQIATEVTTQLVPYAARLDKMQDDQSLLKQQLSDISNQLKQNTKASNNISHNFPPLPSPSVSVPAVSLNTTIVPPTAHHPATVLPSLVPAHLSQDDVSAIESAKCTLNFSPITCDDLERMKKNENENVSESELLTRALHEFLDVNMNIPNLQSGK